MKDFISVCVKSACIFRFRFRGGGYVRACYGEERLLRPKFILSNSGVTVIIAKSKETEVVLS